MSTQLSFESDYTNIDVLNYDHDNTDVYAPHSPVLPPINAINPSDMRNVTHDASYDIQNHHSHMFVNTEDDVFLRLSVWYHFIICCLYTAQSLRA